jgi:hypothetical protein
VEFPPMMKRIPNLPFLQHFHLTNSAIDEKDTIHIDEKQVQEHKSIQFPGKIKVIRYNNNWLWGKIVSRKKFGIKYSVFLIGGLGLTDSKDLGGLLKKVFKAHRVLFIEIVSCQKNTTNALIKNWTQTTAMNGFIYFNLNMPEATRFNVTLGAIDVF